MEKAGARCENCKHYQAYYTKGVCRFEKQKIGYCAILEQTLDKYHLCSAWKSNEERLETSKRVAEKTLDDLLLQTAEVKQILEEAKK